MYSSHLKAHCSVLLVLAFLILLPYQETFTQENRQGEILARVLDSKTKIPIVFASVVLVKNGNGVIADKDGYFRLPYKYKLLKEVIKISSIGYATKEIPVATLINGRMNQILLVPKTEELKGVTLSGTTSVATAKFKPEDIVRRAIQRISSSCPTNPYSYIAYYRDYQLQENEYINLNEALIEVFDAGYNSDKLTDSYNKTALYEYMENVAFYRDTLWSSSYKGSGQKFIKDAKISALGGNELSILNLHDPIRNRSRNSFSFVHTFKTDFLEYHKFKFEGITYRDDIPMYHLSFKTKDEKIKSRYSAEGAIYIAKDTYGIYKLSYKGFERHAYDPLYSLELEYVPKENEMVLNYISFNNNFQVKSKGNFKIDAILLDTDENAFFLTFNNEVKGSTVANLRNYRFIYDKKKLKISKAELIHPKSIKISLVNGTLPKLENLDETIMSKVHYKIKNIEDLLGRKLNKLSLVTINQFRELFVQKVFLEKALPLNGQFIDKNAPLSESKKMPFNNRSEYWVNTPLKLGN